MPDAVLSTRDQRVLCFSPYSSWQPHGAFEIAVLHSLRLRGAETRLVFCDGLFTDCDLHWQSLRPKDRMSCATCQSRTTGMAVQMLMEYEWIGRQIGPADRDEAQRWVDSLSDEVLIDATYGDYPVGAWVKSSINSHFRVSQIDLADPQIAAGYRSYLFSGLLACWALDRLLDEFDPTVLLLFNGRLAPTRVALELARRRGIRVVTHEVGAIKNTMRLFENGNCHMLEPLKQIWRDWGDVPLQRHELEAIADYLQGRETGRTVMKAFSPPPQDPEGLRAQLGLAPGRRVWAAFTSSDDEVISATQWTGCFPSQLDWITRTVEWFRKNSDLELVIRVHPNTAGKLARGNNLKQLEEMERLRASLPANVRMVMPEDAVSTYTLMELAEVGLTYVSTAGLEMACKGKPILVGSGCYISDLPFVKTVKSLDQFEPLLESMRELPDAEGQSWIRRRAYRFAYGFFLRYDMPFDLVKISPDNQKILFGFKTGNELLPGADVALDRVVRILVADEPVLPPPRLSERLALDADERSWFGLQQAEEGEEHVFRPDLPAWPLEDRKGTVFFHHPHWASPAWREVLTSFAGTFEAKDDVTLVLWLDPAQGLSIDVAAAQVMALLAEKGLLTEDTPDLLIVPDALTVEGLARLYAAADWIVPAGDEQQAERAAKVGRRVLGSLAPEAWREAVGALSQRR